MSSHTCVVTKNFNLEAEEGAVSPLAPPSPPPLPPAKKPKQGIGSILGSDSDHKAKTAPAAASIRRTLSADMSSKKWLSHNGFSTSPTMKKIASSAEFAEDHHSFSAEEDDLINRPGQDEVWRAIQAQKLHQNDRNHIKPELRSCESWSSILLSQKTQDSSKLPPPYIHPLVKRTASSLSEKSLEICTESLGSETGSEGFSSHPPSESGDGEEKEDHHNQQTTDREEEIKEYNYSPSFEFQAVKHSCSKRSPPRSFPPPLPSLAKNKASVQVLSRRQNGRLILEAVSVPPRNYLRAERHDGRLLLTLVNGSSPQEASHEEAEDQDEETENVFDNFEEIDDNVISDSYEEEEEEEEGEEEEQEWTKGMGIAVEQNSNLPNRSSFMKQFTGLNCKRNTLWTNKKAVNLMEEEEDLIITPLPPHSLPPPPVVAGLIPAPSPAARAAFINTYDYFWRTNPTVASVIDTEQCKGTTKYLKNNNNNAVESPKLAAYKQKDSVVLLRGSKANNMIPTLRGCKEPRRSLLLWEPYCIATT